MYSARAATVPCPHPSSAIFLLMYWPILQYRSISAVLTAVTTREQMGSARLERESVGARLVVPKISYFHPGLLGNNLEHHSASSGDSAIQVPAQKRVAEKISRCISGQSAYGPLAVSSTQKCVQS